MVGQIIGTFRGRYFFLSNFYPVGVLLDGLIYPSVEYAYCAAKTLDEEERKRILYAASPGLAKRLGRQVTLRADWESIKLDVMANLLRQKFSKENPTLRMWLAETGDADIVEGNTWGDTFWGVYDGRGQNHLGRLLMEIRAEMLAE